VSSDVHVNYSLWENSRRIIALVFATTMATCGELPSSSLEANRCRTPGSSEICRLGIRHPGNEGQQSGVTTRWPLQPGQTSCDAWVRTCACLQRKAWIVVRCFSAVHVFN